MIIGIDESGSFDSSSLSIYVAVFIKPSILEGLEKEFLKWENSLPKECSDSGEIKGSLLSEEYLEQFVDEILTKNKIYYSCFAIKLDQNNLDALQKQKEILINGSKEAVGFYRFRGKRFEESATDYKKMYKWLRRIKLVNLGKITLLGQTICESFNSSIIISTLNGFDKELGKLEFRIDKDFIPKEKELYWKDLVRMQIYHYSTIYPFLEIKEWDENHPYKKTFLKDPKSKKKKTVFSKEFKKRIRYYDSEKEFVVRIADITATILRRHINDRSHQGVYRKLKKLKYPNDKFSCKQIIIDSGKINKKNPYKYHWMRIYRFIKFFQRKIGR